MIETSRNSMRNINILRILRRWPTSSVIILGLVCVAGIFAPLLAPYDPSAISLADRHLPPVFFGGTWEHPFGTDPMGRDIFSRIIHGARISMFVAGIALISGGLFGTSIGLISGYMGGWVDEILMRIVDIKYSLPLILIALALALLLGPSLKLLLGLLAFLVWGAFARQVRGEVLLLKELDYVSMARVSGASTFRVLYKHVLPGVLNTVVVVATLQVGSVILAEASLSFLGAGVPPPTPTWGAMIASGRMYIDDAWWDCLVPGLAILLTVLALTLLGDWLRDRIDPRLRQLE